MWSTTVLLSRPPPQIDNTSQIDPTAAVYSELSNTQVYTSSLQIINSGFTSTLAEVNMNIVKTKISHYYLVFAIMFVFSDAASPVNLEYITYAQRPTVFAHFKFTAQAERSLWRAVGGTTSFGKLLQKALCNTSPNF